MSESETKEKSSSSGTGAAPPNSTISSSPATASSVRGRGGGRSHHRGGGRGGGGGRGRGRSGGRGRGGRHQSSAKHNDSNSINEDPHHHQNEHSSNHEETKAAATGGNAPEESSSVVGRGKGRVDGGRGRLGGRGRGRNGRGGKGRGRVFNKNHSRSNSPVPSDIIEDEEKESYSEKPTDQSAVQDFSIDEEYSVLDKDRNDLPKGGDETEPVTFLSHQTLSLPPPPRHMGRKGGVPMILSRKDNPLPNLKALPKDSNAVTNSKALSRRITPIALDEGIGGEEEKKDVTPDILIGPDSFQNVEIVGKPPKHEKKKPKKKKKDKTMDSSQTEVIEPEVSTTDALLKMPAQEVSITATTTVQIRKSESSMSVNRLGDEASIKFDGTSKTIKGIKKGKSKKKKGLSKDDAVNQKAAKLFNKSVRSCVERSDPDGVKELLHDKYNHNFALDSNVLELVMKAYVMAAMFEDGLYCLRNCALPGTLSTLQTERILTCLPQNLRNSSAYTAADMINALCIATEFDNPTSRTYFLRIVRGISLEFLEEVMSARDRICSATCERLVRSAVCVVNARLKRGKKPSEFVVQPGEQLGVFVPDSMENRGIQAGDAVSILPYAGPYPMSAESLDRNMIEATVTNMNPMVLRLPSKVSPELYSYLTDPQEGNVFRIDKLANRMGFNRQLSAAVAIACPLGDSKTRDMRRPSPQLIKAITAMDENIDRVMNHSGSFKKNELTSTAALCAEAVPWSYDDEDNDGGDEDGRRSASKLALETYNALDGLNESQQLAVEGAVTNRLTLVQGPPGTGKTAVAIRILQHWARLATAESKNGETLSPIMATSDSNIAVDNLVEGCAAAGLQVVRLGRPEAIRPELLRFCIDRPPSSYNSGGNKDESGNNPALNFKERMKALKKAQIVCCTCIGSGGDILDSMTFDRVLVDEATQATEPAVLVPLMRGCRQLVLVGDHCQLPPTVLSTRAEEEGHGVPLFSRMVACGVPPFMLDTQYRMHPCIAMFPSDLFYGGKLLNGVTAPERRPLAGFPWPREEFPVAFCPVKGTEMDDGVSKMNEAEATRACDVVAALLSGGQCNPSDIAVVTPYAAQARLIRRLTRQLLPQNPGQTYIEVSSVDGFQGREKEAVVFSAVRSNDYGAIGFTSDWRRVNVSFTRARRALIVIGNDQTLRRGDPETWSPWLAWADAHGLNMDKPGVSRGRYDPEQLRRVRGGTTAAEMLKDVLARQQAQLKTAERQLQNATKNAAGHIIGKEDDEEHKEDSVDNELTLEEDLAQITNAEGNWDSDNEEDYDLHRSASQPTLSSAGRTTNDSSSSDAESPTDIWDL